MFRKTVNEQKARPSWNRGKLIGQKPPLKLKDIWAIRVRLQLAGRLRDLALFNLAIDSKLRACDLVRIRVQDLCHAGRVTYPGDSTRGCCTAGWPISDLIPLPMALTRSGAPRHR